MNEWINQIERRAVSSSVPVASGRSGRVMDYSWSDIGFLPAQLSTRPVDYFTETIGTEIILGPKTAKPLTSSWPIMFAAMSFGALSREAKTVLAKAAKRLNVPANTGEGGTLPEELKYAKPLIIQYSTGRFGITEALLKKADAIEIKIGQGAKGGQGGFLPKAKITDEIARIRMISKDKDAHSPAYHPDINDLVDLKQKINWLRKITGGVPIIVKIAAGHIKDDITIAVKAGADIIALDGTEGATGAAPEVLLQYMGLPVLPALITARSVLNQLKASQQLIIGGGIYSGADMAKAIALGADAVYVGTGLMVSMGCTACSLCYTGRCPKGIATQLPELRQKLNQNEAIERIVNYIKNCGEEIKMIAGACGHDHINKLNPKDLYTLNENLRQISNIKRVGE